MTGLCGVDGFSFGTDVLAHVPIYKEKASQERRKLSVSTKGPHGLAGSESVSVFNVPL